MKNPKIPVYKKIARKLKHEIVNGKYPVGTQLPVESELCERFDVSRHTIREALRVLREENLVFSRKKAGTVVVPHQRPISNFLHALSVDELVTFSRRWHFVIDSVKTETVEENLAGWAGLSDREGWLAARGVAQLERTAPPECWAVYYVNPKYASIAGILHDRDDPILPMIEAVFGIRVTEVEQEISAVMIPDDVAERIEASRNQPAINVRRICRTDTQEVVLTTSEVYPSSRFRYNFLVHRDRS